LLFLGPCVCSHHAQAEEVKFRAQLRELEQQRMAVLEAQWWKMEQAREAELAAMKADFTKLQQQTQAVLTTAQVSCLYDVAAWQEKRCSTCQCSHSRIPLSRTVMSMLQHSMFSTRRHPGKCWSCAGLHYQVLLWHAAACPLLQA
jgi:excinuclease UvrABC ATPase subunit